VRLDNFIKLLVAFSQFLVLLCHLLLFLPLLFRGRFGGIGIVLTCLALTAASWGRYRLFGNGFGGNAHDYWGFKDVDEAFDVGSATPLIVFFYRQGDGTKLARAFRECRELGVGKTTYLAS